jgi:hypothetical protein
VGLVQGAVGITLKLPVYSSGYEQPATVVIPPDVLALSNYPSKLCVALLGMEVNVGTGIVITVAVVV